MAGWRFRRRALIEPVIASAALADIAFLLFIFFAVSTAFRMQDYVGKHPVYPSANAMSRIGERRQDILRLWIVQGDVYVGDAQVPVAGVASLLRPFVEERPDLLIALRADRDTDFGTLNAVLAQLKEAGATRVSFTTVKEHARALDRHTQ
jgi:biopolymer transport protein ExbD